MNPEILSLLACPKCPERPALRLEGDRLVCTVCSYAYPIVDGIPQLLIEDAIAPEGAKSE